MVGEREAPTRGSGGESDRGDRRPGPPSRTCRRTTGSSSAFDSAVLRRRHRARVRRRPKRTAGAPTHPVDGRTARRRSRSARCRRAGAARQGSPLPVAGGVPPGARPVGRDRPRGEAPHRDQPRIRREKPMGVRRPGAAFRRPTRPACWPARCSTPAFGDPRRWHPVAGFGRAAGALERRMYAARPAGRRAVHAVAVGVPVLVGVAAVPRYPAPAGGPGRAGRRRTWAVLGGALAAPGGRRDGAARWTLATSPGARDRLPHLCGRDPAALGRAELARATIESVAENTSDAEVGAAVLGRAGGPAGAASATGRSTPSTRWSATARRGTREFGTAAARLDDLANLAPARLTAAADRGGCAAGRRLGAGAGAADLAARRVPAPQPQLRPVRGGDGRRTRRPARRPQRVPRAGGGAADARRRPGAAGDGHPPGGADLGAVVRRGGLALVSGGAGRRSVASRPVPARCKARRGGRGRDGAGRTGWGRDERRAAGRGHHLGRGQERAHRRHLPLAAPARGRGRAVQGAEHVQQLGGRGRPDGRGGEIGRAQAHAGRRVRAGARACGSTRCCSSPAPTTAARSSCSGEAVGTVDAANFRELGRGCAETVLDDAGRAAGRLRRGDLRGRRQPDRDQPAGRRLRQHGAGARRRAAGDRGRRHRPGRRVRGAVRHPRPARRRATRRCIAGFVVNKFRGDLGLLRARASTRSPS